MTMEEAELSARRPDRPVFYNDPFWRSLAYQLLTILVLAGAIVWMWTNTLENLKRANLSSGFGFLQSRAGFDLAQALIPYSSDSSYFRALEVGLLNTLAVAALGIVTTTILGLLIGIGRLSSNWLVRKLATVYVEAFRNIPLLVIIFFWYKGVLNALPNVRESIVMPFGMILNNRGFYFPAPIFGEGSILILVALAVGILAAFLWSRRAKAQQMATGKRPPVFWVNVALVLGLPILTFLVLGAPLTFDMPVAGKFNISGGNIVGPEFMSLYLALSFYTAAFIAEIVRAGIRGVAKGQTEAAYALGIQPGRTMRLVILPQALRIIIPPMTSQYLNLTKNSSLAVAIGYADLVAVGGTILNQTGRAIEVVAIWLLIYVSISLATSLFMNWFNRKMALVER
ncbi:amino acid ABC transporter permease [Gellertiella hungarica]|uniref:General L-amino acid transport system permease protein n=1 Tax=Gellertiella hungarica TaxID=1572859 RepID=A0A7W6NL03_9HYPH|nr:amino acid ABC transporter permease [Gellertiella hungarica]MBB4064945.1 general L-amino acid transport system permease protein [Gellertiella hungarica]